jgi:hypothetical protein
MVLLRFFEASEDSLRCFAHFCGRKPAEAAKQRRLAGAPGFEPGNGGIKIRCLTTWLRPNIGRPDADGGRTIEAEAVSINGLASALDRQS